MSSEGGKDATTLSTPVERLFQRGRRGSLSQGTSSDSVQLQGVRSSIWLSPEEHGPRGQEGVSKECA